MRRNKGNTNKMKKACRLAVGCLLLFFLDGNAIAQDGRFVIKKKAVSDTDIHYLKHVKNGEGEWELQDATVFSPACLWISDNTFCPGGTNKNYYFYDDDGVTPLFLASTQFQEGGSLTLSSADAVPSGSDLGRPEYYYYFYRWDSGLGRGVQYYGFTETTCEHEWEWLDEEHTKGECWEVYWVSYDSESDTWKLSDEHYGLNDVPNGAGARYHAVTITEHTQDTIPIEGELSPLSPLSMEWGGSSQTLTPPVTLNYVYKFTPAYTTYVVNESYYGHTPNPINVTHNYWGGTDHGTVEPDEETRTENSVSSCRWTITGDAAGYLSFSSTSGSNVTTIIDDEPTLYYSIQNTTGDKTATLTLTVTYGNGAKQTSTTTVEVKTPCQNPAMVGTPDIAYTGVTLSWYPTATAYTVSWQKAGASSWNSVELLNVTSYTIRGLDFATTYNYKVKATSCETGDPTPGSFTTLAEPPGLVLFGAVFGGGRMADVGGKTEVVVINGKEISAVYGGNDIAGSVENANGSTITLGVNTGGTYASYGTTTAPIKIGSVYGGGNGYYAYNGSSFVPAASDYTHQEVAVNGHVNAMTQSHTVGEVVWTNTGTEPQTLNFPSIAKTDITVTNDYVKVDSLFGGAKNAFLTNTTNDVNITINGGTMFAVFGGNNFGGTLGEGSKEKIVVNDTKTWSSGNNYNTGHGLQFGIRYLFGGGNKIPGRNVEIEIHGGQMDTIFGGGNSADVLSTQLTVECDLAAGTSSPFGKVYSNAISECAEGTLALTINNNYAWDRSGMYNIRTLFGGNNKAPMTGLPVVNLTSGGIGTVYGGGNSGDMLKQQTGGLITFPDPDEELGNFEFDYSTYVKMDSPSILVDYLYGGCQMSNVKYSTWVELKKGHVGTVYGGCNISGDVGSTRANPSAPNIPATLADQEVYGGTYVKAGGADDDNIIVYNNLIAGSNGYYNCSQDGIHYNGDSNFDDPTGKYEGLKVPTHNETHAIISKGATIKGNVYAGGNLACVGFDDGTGFDYGFPELIGLASLRMDGGTVDGNVYGGGNLASIYGINEVRVSGGSIGLAKNGALYGGNDCSGQVAEKTNRILPPNYTVASDGHTSLTALGVKTYVSVKGSPQINTVYGGGNGAYDSNEVQYCYSNFEPIQSYTFVDIHTNGGSNPGHIGTVYGGGNGVTVRHGVTVFFNIQNEGESDVAHVDTIFGGNNKGSLDVVSNILLLHGKVGTVYGGCNQGAMIATNNTKRIGDYDDIGSYVRLMDKYVVVTNNATNPPTTHEETVTAKVTEAIYGGCRMNGVTNNSLVLVEGGDFSSIPLFGGSDISGTVEGKSMVAVVDGAVGNVYGGGNGNYYYKQVPNVGVTGNHYEVYSDASMTPSSMVADSVPGAPACVNSGADILGGTVGTSGSHKNVYGGGYGQMTNTTGDVVVNIGAIALDGEGNEVHSSTPLLYGDVYGGSALGSVNNTLVNVFNGEHNGNIYGGGHGQASPDISATVTGDVVVNIGQDDSGTLLGSAVIVGNVFGANNIMGSPEGAITVNVYKGSMTNVFGGGNLATTTVTGNYPAVNVYGGTISQDVFGGGLGLADTDKGKVIGNPQVTINGADVLLSGGVYGGGSLAPTEGDAVVTLVNGATTNIYGGGKAANVTGDPTVLIQGGTVSTGVYGGCNTSGTITGNTTVTLTGGTIGTAETSANVHGGGYGQPTSVTGNVTINFGTDNDTYDENLKLFGDLYGGSALGNVNTNGYNTTTIDVYNGIINGNVFGGGLGSSTVEAKVYGKIHVNIGKMITHLDTGEEPTFSGKANLTNCSVFGCNNVKGSPQDEVFVDVYQTYRRLSDEVDAVGNVTYAILNVFGGGNRANYSPASTQKTHVYVHGCENTAEFLYAGGNAADAYGVEIVVEGGRFNEAYGGGNGLIVPANIGDGGIGYNFHGGHYGFTYEGSNKNGINTGGVMDTPLLLPTGYSVECGGSFTDSHFFGANMAEIYVDVLENIIRCEDAESYHYKNVYAGSRWALIYGDVKLTVCGGEIENLFGGSQGYRASATDPGFSADIRKYPTFQQIYEDEQAHSNVDERKYSQALKDHMGYTGNPNAPQPDYAGQGGNIILIVNGGTIGNVIGGCNVNGNVEGKITVIVEDAEANTCELYVGNVFGGSNEAGYWPTGTDGTDSPKVTIVKGTLGMEHDFNSNGVINEGERFDGNVFGGGNKGDITATPKVIVGDGTTGSTATKVSIGGSVYGGGDQGNVTGSANVIVVPIRHSLTVTTPDPISTTPASENVVRVTNSLGQDMNGTQVGEGHVLMIQAIASPYGYKFDHWTCVNGTIANSNKAVTTFTMGTANATITAHFTTVDTHKLTYSATGGSVAVFDGQGHEVDNNRNISEGAVLNIVATPADAAHEFHEWTATNGTIASISSPSTTFTMGTDDVDATITAIFSEITTTHTLSFDSSPGNGSFTVKDAHGTPLISPATVGEGVTLSLDVDPESITAGYAFIKWTTINATVANASALSTTFRMGADDATLSATFAPTYTFTVVTPVNGAVRVLDGEGNIVNSGASVGAGATLHIKAMPVAGYAFEKWEVTEGNGTIANSNAANTTFTMGTEATIIKATFVPTHILTLTPPEHGTVKITNTNGGQTVTCPASIGEYATLQLKASPAVGYHFTGWTVTGTGSNVYPNASTTTFTMGTADTNIQANFVHD